MEILNNQGNIQLGFVEIADSFSMDPGLANYWASNSKSFFPR